MTDNPTGAENAQVQERTAIEELGRGLTALYLEVAPSIADDIRARADAALHETEQRGRDGAFKECADIAWGFADDPAALKVARAIERAAKED